MSAHASPTSNSSSLQYDYSSASFEVLNAPLKRKTSCQHVELTPCQACQTCKIQRQTLSDCGENLKIRIKDFAPYLKPQNKRSYLQCQKMNENQEDQGMLNFRTELIQYPVIDQKQSEFQQFSVRKRDQKYLQELKTLSSNLHFNSEDLLNNSNYQERKVIIHDGNGFTPSKFPVVYTQFRSSNKVLDTQDLPMHNFQDYSIQPMIHSSNNHPIYQNQKELQRNQQNYIQSFQQNDIVISNAANKPIKLPPNDFKISFSSKDLREDSEMLLIDQPTGLPLANDNYFGIQQPEKNSGVQNPDSLLSFDYQLSFPVDYSSESDLSSEEKQPVQHFSEFDYECNQSQDEQECMMEVDTQQNLLKSKERTKRNQKTCTIGDQLNTNQESSNLQIGLNGKTYYGKKRGRKPNILKENEAFMEADHNSKPTCRRYLRKQILLGQVDRPYEQTKHILNPEEDGALELEPEDFVSDTVQNVAQIIRQPVRNSQLSHDKQSSMMNQQPFHSDIFSQITFFDKEPKVKNMPFQRINMSQLSNLPRFNQNGMNSNVIEENDDDFKLKISTRLNGTAKNLKSDNYISKGQKKRGRPSFKELAQKFSQVVISQPSALYSSKINETQMQQSLSKKENPPIQLNHYQVMEMMMRDDNQPEIQDLSSQQ
ncbi:UNKNOWN [Stylonychia lemnae]|uniref:Uncharacterized protein n=1 Tax=Stylonychia lemnae TaxID=5949 RepID=A0A078A0Y3_STYLE|nr:UNKNOWN [Stylonychia lemnae]|eukprot:CDW75851.1 UNKNOWN [Stylonychia lemnae]